MSVTAVDATADAVVALAQVAEQSGGEEDQHEGFAAASMRCYLEIAKLLASIMAHSSATRVYRILTGLPIVAAKQRRYTPLTGPITDAVLIARLRRYMKFATACFGWQLMQAFYGHTSSLSALSGWMKGLAAATRSENGNRELLVQFTGIPDSDVLRAEFRSLEFLRPAHYVAIDRRAGVVVVAVRGTMSLSDTLTDIAATPGALQDGYGHQGMVEAARLLARSLRPLLRDTLQRNPDIRRVVTTGHSLGAGTASLLALLLHDEFDVECFAFAPPPVMSPALAARCAFIHTVVFRDDIVPRLSLCSLFDLRDRAAAAASAPATPSAAAARKKPDTASTFLARSMQGLVDGVRTLVDGVLGRSRSTSAPLTRADSATGVAAGDRTPLRAASPVPSSDSGAAARRGEYGQALPPAPLPSTPAGATPPGLVVRREDSARVPSGMTLDASPEAPLMPAPPALTAAAELALLDALDVDASERGLTPSDMQRHHAAASAAAATLTSCGSADPGQTSLAVVSAAAQAAAAASAGAVGSVEAARAAAATQAELTGAAPEPATAPVVAGAGVATATAAAAAAAAAPSVPSPVGVPSAETALPLSPTRPLPPPPPLLPSFRIRTGKADAGLRAEFGPGSPLRLAGTVYVMDQAGIGLPPTLCRASPEDFAHIVLSSTMFADHMPGVYEKALDALLVEHAQVKLRPWTPRGVGTTLSPLTPGDDLSVSALR